MGGESIINHIASLKTRAPRLYIGWGGSFLQRWEHRGAEQSRAEAWPVSAPAPTPIWGFEICTHETVREQYMYSAIRANWCGSEEEEKEEEEGCPAFGSRTSLDL